MNNTATWIWFYGDFEIRQLLKMDTRRMERGFTRPAPWQLDDCWHNVDGREYAVPEKETLLIKRG